MRILSSEGKHLVLTTLSMRRFTCFVALVFCVVQVIADTHLHLEEHDEGDCTVCAIVEPGSVVEISRPYIQIWRWHLVEGSPTYVVALPARPYALDWSRAPPIS